MHLIKTLSRLNIHVYRNFGVCSRACMQVCLWVGGSEGGAASLRWVSGFKWSAPRRSNIVQRYTCLFCRAVG